MIATPFARHECVFGRLKLGTCVDQPLGHIVTGVDCVPAGDVHLHRIGDSLIHRFPLVLLETEAHLSGPMEPVNAVSASVSSAHVCM